MTRKAIRLLRVWSIFLCAALILGAPSGSLDQAFAGEARSGVGGEFSDALTPIQSEKNSLDLPVDQPGATLEAGSSPVEVRDGNISTEIAAEPAAEEAKDPAGEAVSSPAAELEKSAPEAARPVSSKPHADARLQLKNLSLGLRYNEAYDGSGNLRPAYQAFMKRTGIDTLHPQQSWARRLAAGHPMGDKIKILPVPLILPRYEYVTQVQAGAAQRLNALASFFVDMVLLHGRLIFNPKLRSKYRVPEELTEDLTRSIFLDEGFHLDGARRVWSKRSVEDVNIFYGPDIVRNPEGRWVVLEDNIARGVALGGVSDLSAIQRAYRGAAGRAAIKIPEPNFFFAAIANFLAKKKLSPKRAVALVRDYAAAKSLGPVDRLGEDMETLREIRTLEGMGIKILDSDRLARSEKRKMSDGEYGAILNIDNPADPNESNELWNGVFATGKAAFLSAPALSAASSKALLPFVEDLIRFYLKQEPILKTQPTKILTREDIGMIALEPDRWVVKAAGKDAGEGVYILGRMETKERQAFLRGLDDLYRSKLHPGERKPIYVLQKRMEPSVIPPTSGLPVWDDFYVDLRPLMAAFGNELYGTSVPWGRAVPTVGRGLNNVTQGAYELVVLLEGQKSK